MTRYFGVHTHEGEWHSLLPRYVLLSDRIEGKKILDIGCGTGIGSSLLLEMGAETVNAIDHRPEVLELARVKHAKQGLTFHVMFWEELDFPDDTFDMVLCLDPTSPVTDPNLLNEITRVLNTGGEYVCAIERRTVEGIETLLPRYGYNSAGEQLDLTPSEERVPQIGQLDDYFETIVSIVQRPRYSFVFDFPGDDDEHTMRRSSDDNDESGLWVGDDPSSEHGAVEQTDERPGRWLSIDERLADRDGDPAAVELLYCGGEHMPPPSPREVEMPYRGLVERLHQLFSELQLRQHPDQAGDGEQTNPFEEREQTSEFRKRADGNRPRRQPDPSRTGGEYRHYQADNSSATGRRFEPDDSGWHALKEQLDHMTNLYREVRADMQNLFIQTRNELAERDRYIEQLVDTVHRWRQQDLQRRESNGDASPTAPKPTPDETKNAGEDSFEKAPTMIFSRAESGEIDAVADGDEPDEQSDEAAASNPQPRASKAGEDDDADDGSTSAADPSADSEDEPTRVDADAKPDSNPDEHDTTPSTADTDGDGDDATDPSTSEACASLTSDSEAANQHD